jgi:osmoprotectant transport system substrate-binding protein
MNTPQLSKEELESQLAPFHHERLQLENEIRKLQLELKNNEHRALSKDLQHQHELSKGNLTELSLNLSRSIKEDFFRLINLAVWITTAIFATVGIVATFGGYLSLKDLIKNRIGEQLEKETQAVEKVLNAKFSVYENNVKESIQKIEKTRDQLVSTEFQTQQLIQNIQKSYQKIQQDMDAVLQEMNHSRSLIDSEMNAFKKEGGRFKQHLENYSNQVKRYTDKIELTTFKTKQTLNYLITAIVKPNPSLLQPWKALQNSHKNIILASNTYTESRILCALLAQLLKNHQKEIGFDSILPQYDYGTTPLQLLALTNGTLDIAPSYTWSGFEMTLGPSLYGITPKLQSLSTEQAIQELNLLCKKNNEGLCWLAPLGFQVNWELLMVREKAQLFGIQNISDLQKFKERFIFGGELEFFQRDAGYPTLLAPPPHGYGLLFSKVLTYPHEDIYQILDHEQVDIIDGFSSDVRLAELDSTGKSRYLRLVDDQKLLGKYEACFVAREAFLQKYPKVLPLLEKLRYKISETQIRLLIQKVEEYTWGELKLNPYQAAEKVADEFLKTF